MRAYSRKANKTHTCMSCGKDIEKETKYIIAIMSWKSRVYQGKFHDKHCLKIDLDKKVEKEGYRMQSKEMDILR